MSRRRRCIQYIVCLCLLYFAIIPTIYLYTRQDGFYIPSRNCKVPWQTIGNASKPRICITTLSDSKLTEKYTNITNRDFSNVLELTWPNRVRYAEKHNYSLFNASDLIDPTRHTSWSKIVAAKDALQKGCDWVLWMDADSLIMNLDIRIEDFIPSNTEEHFILTFDINGYNAGMWMIHRSEWAFQFLDEWWSKTRYLTNPRNSYSGDNFALNVLLRKKYKDHFLVAPQCAFNSYYWPDHNSRARVLKHKWFWTRQDYLWMNGRYTKGDFVLHFAGVENKEFMIKQYQGQATRRSS